MAYKAFVSSTFEDLRKHRAKVIAELRRAGIQVDPMEDWTSATEEPKTLSQQRLEGCDFCVLLVALRRGFVPDGETRSITQLEYHEAQTLGVDVLAFMLHEQSPWPETFDERLSDPQVQTWRQQLAHRRVVGFFDRDPDSIDIAPTVVRWLTERHHKSDWIAPFRDWFELYFSPFRRRYFEKLCYRHRVFNVRGLRTQGAFTLELESVFVDLHVAPQIADGTSADPIRQAVRPGHRNIWQLMAKRDHAYRCLAIIGAPGSGKSTLVQHLALTFAQRKQRHYDRRCDAYVPVVLFLRQHADVLSADPAPTLAELVTALEQEELRPPAEWFERQLQAGRCLVLLDGLDEIADAAERQRVVGWVTEQLRHYGRSRFVITSRPHGYKSNPLPQATVLEVQPLTLSQVEAFVGNWYVVNEILSFGKDDAGARASAAEGAEDLMHRLRHAPSLAALAVNPLLLTMIAMVHRYRGILPDRRVELYAEICDVLLGHWQAAKGVVATMTPAQKRVALQALALHMMQTRAREITATEAEAVIRQPLKRLGDAGNCGAKIFLEDVERSSSLLLEREAGVYSFAHLTFQEYLAAAALLERPDDEILDHVDDGWWHETIRLYGAQADATGIIRACLQRGAPESLRLAYECALEAKTVEPEMRAQLDRQLIDGLEDDEPENRRLASEAMLSLRLRNLLRLSDAAEIDTSYVSCAEYQLFMDEMLAAGRAYRPDHWQAGQFPPGMGLQPIAGVRYSDALAFCAWLTERTRGQSHRESRFRLPTPDEARLSPLSSMTSEEQMSSLRSTAVGAWCDTEPASLLEAPDLIDDRLAEDLKHMVRPYLSRTLSLAVHLLGTTDAAAVERAVGQAGDTLEPALERDQNPAGTLTQILDLDPSLTRRLGQVRVLGVDLERARARCETLDLDRLAALDSPRAEDLARKLDGGGGGHAQSLDRALRLYRNVDNDRTRASALPAVLEKTETRTLALASAEELDGARLAVLYLIGTELDLAASNPGPSEREAYLEAFWTLVLFQQRIEGKLPARESIRLVREQAAPTD